MKSNNGFRAGLQTRTTPTSRPVHNTLTRPRNSCIARAKVCTASSVATALQVATLTLFNGALVGITKQHEFDLSYDFLVTAVGSVPNTFGVPGVEDNCLFFKEIGDAAELRHRVNRALERASLPETPKKRAAQLLTVAIVGGGPTGVELAGELYDLLREDVAKQYSPELLSLVKVRLSASRHAAEGNDPPYAERVALSIGCDP
eukprot:scaffold4362_cov390-Prasinococcus_capsulatus_cf.AAC.2